MLGNVKTSSALYAFEKMEKCWFFYQFNHHQLMKLILEEYAVLLSI